MPSTAEEIPLWPGQEELAQEESAWPGERFDPDEYAKANRLGPVPEKVLPSNSDRQPLGTGSSIESAPRRLELPVATTRGIGSAATKLTTAKEARVEKEPVAEPEPSSESDQPSPERQLLNSMKSRLKLLAGELEAQAEEAFELSKRDIDNYQRKAAAVLKLAESLPDTILSEAERNKLTLPHRLKSTLGITKFDIALDRSKNKVVKSKLLDRKEAIQLSAQIASDQDQAEQFSSWRLTRTGGDLFDKLIAARNKGAAEKANVQLFKDRTDTENRVQKILESDKEMDTLTAKVREEYISQFAVSLHRQLDRYEQDVEAGDTDRADLPADSMVVAALASAETQSMREVLTREQLIVPDVKAYTKEAHATAIKTFSDNVEAIAGKFASEEREQKAAVERAAVIRAFESNFAKNLEVLAFARAQEHTYQDIRDAEMRNRRIRNAINRKYHSDVSTGNDDAVSYAMAKYYIPPKGAR